jgi:hypothetical protein
MKTPKTMLRKRDLLWLLAYPLYQVIGTLRHELSHALVAWLEGATITEFKFIPTQGYWGYVRWSGPTDWLTLAAPYFVDLLTFVIFFWLCTSIKFHRHWLWLNAVIIGMLSPLVNTAYNYSGFIRGTNDIGRLLQVLPPFAVHAYMVLTILLYCIGLWWVFKPHPS